tara:strand:+ start:18108 stop:19292 length:1185 start_codon:yes stop_codon:yes gene_type:complete
MNTLKNFDFKNKIALVRVDFNVPLDDKSNITDTTRIDLGVKTIRYIIKNGGKCVVMSHLGRPRGLGFEKKFSLVHILKYFSKIFNQEIPLVKDFFNKEFNIENYLHDSNIVLLENLRFYSEEKENDKYFSKNLASMGDIYVNNAFGTCHRKHSSTYGIIKYINKYCIGDLVEEEIKNIEKVLYDNKKPFTAILGGSKVSDKINVIKRLIDLVDNIIIGGAMANTFLKANGVCVGKSLFEEDKLDIALQLQENARKKNVKIHLPVDFICAKSLYDNVTEVFDVKSIPSNYSCYDIGNKTVILFEKIILKSKKIIWNGPMGVFEIDKFSAGTFNICDMVASSTHKGTFSLVGGGDSVASVKINNKEKNISFISTGGGALLEYIANGSLPSLELIKS